MTQDYDFWSYPLFHLSNYVFSALIWTCFGRFLLGFFVAPDSRNYIWRWFRRLTDWAVRLAALITPRFVMEAFLPLVAAFWLFVARYAWFIILGALGLRPTLQGAVLGG
jgi:uncharacterized protein YggT (Ycf19 family)